MATRILTVRVSGIALREAGDGADEAGENVVNVALLWPRPGRAEVMGSTGLVRLRDHPERDAEPDRPPMLEAPVLKEKVEGDVALMVHVLERDERGALARFFRQVAAAAVEGAADHALPLVPGLVRQAFTEAAERGAVLVQGPKDDERLEAVAVGAGPLVIPGAELERLAESGEPRRERLVLRVPRRLVREREKGRLSPGRDNGWLELEVAVT